MNGNGTLLASSLLTSSIDSLNSSRSLRSPHKTNSSIISRTYKSASNLFLTRRLPECLRELEPIIYPPSSHHTEDQSEHGEAQNPFQQEHSEPSLIATASKSARVKVWNLYITLLNAIIELGPEDGKAAFGSGKWRELVAKARDGFVWEEVVRYGYHGREGLVDADVVSNLATLLLSHSPDQSLNQSRLESYIARSTEPMLDFSDRFETSSVLSGDYNPKASQTNGTNTPRDLHSRLKIVELYTLHVLPRNDEWEYAREFIQMNELLDDERKDLFLQTLQSLQEQKIEDEGHENELQRERDEELERSRKEEEQRQQEAIAAAQNPHKHEHKRSGSEIDYGIEDQAPKSTIKKTMEKKWTNAKTSTSTNLQPRPKQPTRRPPETLRNRGLALISSLRQMMFGTAEALSKNPSVLLRTLIFIIALLMVLGRRDMRLWLARISGIGWDRVKRTIGMGVKVSYI